MPTTDQLKIRLFCDGADFDSIMRMYKDPLIKGFTTNPTLMRKAGITDYESFGRKVLAAVPDRPVSLEVFADEMYSMEKQARQIATWGSNVNVKIPVTNTKGEFTGTLINRLSHDGIELNVTAIMTLDQINGVADALDRNTPAIVSVFAGRIADTGVDPVPLMAEGLKLLKDRPQAELLWASPRELLNVFQADEIGCHIITATPDILVKLKLVGKDLLEYSLDTVKMFHTDAVAAGFSIDNFERTTTETDEEGSSLQYVRSASEGPSVPGL
jgi:transaldolase